MVGPVAPHDLLVLRGPQALRYAVRHPPTWVAPALQRAPLVVVRRAPAMGDHLSVGIRGQNRSERCAAFLPVGACGTRIAPEDLVATHAWTQNQRLREIGAIHALVEIGPFLQASGLCWGPTGSVGFELASDIPTATTTSDLDVVIRAPQPLAWHTAQALLTHLEKASARLDVQIETPCGALALAEYVRRGPHSQAALLVRTCTGPRWVDDPWQSTPPEGRQWRGAGG